MQGTRIPDGDWPENPGDYAKYFLSKSGKEPNESIPIWMVKVPTGGSVIMLGAPNDDGSPYHWVQEHEDGTITVQPNPPDAPPERRNSNSILWNDWHGYIYRGEWRPC